MSDDDLEFRGFARLNGPGGDADWVPEDDEGTRCYFCGARPAAWALRLNDAQLRRPSAGGFSIGGPLLTCQRCLDLFDEGRDDELVALGVAGFEREYSRDEPWTKQEVEYEFRGPLNAFHVAVLDRRQLTAHVDPFEIAALREAGFEPLDEYTGATDEVGAAWPSEHSRSFPDTRRHAEPGELRWYVRSPWPAVEIDDIFVFLWPQVEYDRNLDPAVRVDRISRVLSWPDGRAQREAQKARRN